MPTVDIQILDLLLTSFLKFVLQDNLINDMEKELLLVPAKTTESTLIKNNTKI